MERQLRKTDRPKLIISYDRSYPAQERAQTINTASMEIINGAASLVDRKHNSIKLLQYKDSSH
jgi:hypothetical protein